MSCGLTVTEDTSPLVISNPSIFPWWSCQNGDLTSWAEPWVLSILVQFPAARLFSQYTEVNTLSGPCWQRNLASEGISLTMDRFSLTFGPSSEQVFSDPTLPGYSITPVYGREATLSVNNASAPNGILTKSTYISTEDSSLNTNCWVIFDIMYQPYSSTLSIYGNGKFILSSPISTDNSGNLILSTFSLQPTPISDPLGEMKLTKTWNDDGVTLPVYTIVPHTAAGYPTSFVSYSPTIGFIDINRGATSLPYHAEVVDKASCAYIADPLIYITGLQAESLPVLTATKGNTFFVEATSANADNGTCQIWWDTTNNGSILLGTTSMVKGVISAGISTKITGFGWIRIVNMSFNLGAGAAYVAANPLPLIVS